MNPIISEDMKEILESGIIDFERLRGKTVLITGAYGMLASYLVFMMIYFNEQSGEEDRIQIIALGRNRDKMKARGLFPLPPAGCDRENRSGRTGRFYNSCRVPRQPEALRDKPRRCHGT